MNGKHLSSSVALLALIALAGCSADDMLARIARPEDDRFARAYVDSLRFGRLDYAASVLAPALAQQPGVRDSLARAAGYLPAGPLDSVHLIGANRFEGGGVSRLRLTYEFHSSAGWGIASVGTATELGMRYVESLNTNRFNESLEAQNAFTLWGKSAGHYLMIALMLASVGASLAAVGMALRTPMRRRWLWALLALVGGGVIFFNWTTGQTGFALLRVQFINAAFSRGSPAAPWILAAAFPIGAVMTFAKIRAVRHASNQAPDQPVEPASPLAS